MTYGFRPDLELFHYEPTDWVFGGASVPCRALIPFGKRTKYLPQGEVQYEADDFEDCATRGPINILETKFNYLLGEHLLTDPEVKWLLDNKYLVNGKVTFSKRWISMMSNTTPTGNSLKAPVDAIHRYGLIPETMLQQMPGMTWTEYNDRTKMTPAMTALGLQFLKYFPINYERVFLADYPSIIENDEIAVAGFAWPNPVNGIYPRTAGAFNHCFMYFLQPAYVIFDNYVDTVDGDYIKLLASDYNLMDYGYRVYIGTKLEELVQPLASQKLLAYLKQLLAQGNWQMVLEICKSLGRAIGMKV
jgi:hypothetical protein